MYCQVLANIRSGAYKLPWDLITIKHRQYNVCLYLTRKCMVFEQLCFITQLQMFKFLFHTTILHKQVNNIIILTGKVPQPRGAGEAQCRGHSQS